MGDTIKVDAADLNQLAGEHDTAATALTSAPAPPVSGSSVWSTTSAVSNGHTLVTAVTASLSTRTRTTGAKVRTAAGTYTSTDEDSAQHLSEVGQSVQV